jgi:type I restriction enzyme S subunit
VSAQELITKHLDLWTGAITKKSTSGRGSNGKIELTGIKKLRELILELAVRGKLTTREACDEPASDLLQRISARQTQLSAQGKIKKPKKLPGVVSEEHYFHLPENWEWVRLGALFDSIMSGGTPSKRNPQFWDGNIPWASVKDLGKTKHLDKTQDYITEEGLKAGSKLADTGDVIICTRMGLGKVAICSRPIAINQDLKAVKVSTEVSLDYFFLAYTTLDVTGTGTTVAGITQDKLLNYVIGLPPIEEQHRIVQKVDELMTLCDRLEQQTSDQLEAHELLVDTLLGTLTQSESAGELADNWARLAAHFDTLFTTEQSIDKLKQTILQLAVMGRLVEQDAGDEPAESLLNRLTDNRQAWLQEQSSSNPECKTMLRKLGKLRPAQSPFPLPKGWRPAHLIQLCRMLVDCHNKTAPYVEEGIPIIRTSNIRERQFNLNGVKYVDGDTYSYWSRRCPPESGDIIFTREAPMGEAAIIPEGKTWCLGQRTMLIRPMHEYISNKFLLLTLTEPHLLERAAEKAIGSTVKHLRVGDVENLVVPVPPIEEQHRIVQKVDELMALCDQLKERLNRASETRCQLAEAVVEGALN